MTSPAATLRTSIIDALEASNACTSRQARLALLFTLILQNMADFETMLNMVPASVYFASAAAAVDIPVKVPRCPDGPVNSVWVFTRPQGKYIHNKGGVEVAEHKRRRTNKDKVRTSIDIAATWT